MKADAARSLSGSAAQRRQGWIGGRDRISLSLLGFSASVPYRIRSWFGCFLRQTLLSEQIAAPDHPFSFSNLVTQRVFALRACTHKAMHMTIGTVKWFNGQKGFGFIQPDNGGPDVFVHISAVERAGWSSLTEGQKIGFESEKDSRSGKMSAGQLVAA